MRSGPDAVELADSVATVLLQPRATLAALRHTALPRIMILLSCIVRACVLLAAGARRRGSELQVEHRHMRFPVCSRWRTSSWGPPFPPLDAMAHLWCASTWGPPFPLQGDAPVLGPSKPLPACGQAPPGRKGQVRAWHCSKTILNLPFLLRTGSALEPSNCLGGWSAR